MLDLCPERIKLEVRAGLRGMAPRAYCLHIRNMPVALIRLGDVSFPGAVAFFALNVDQRPGLVDVLKPPSVKARRMTGQAA